ncbi:hypothetical protein QNM18_04920 [Pseudoalteromonas sp. P94(2023)]|uniref:Uncharacterized protein n=2 Tax=Pseudoalteromonas obscura TaxID=3048491 RepID=A0ABT7EH94_9GAMM|nr:hypothetical protein [Pseudoalteromonas sp. P94(2023)]
MPKPKKVRKKYNVSSRIRSQGDASLKGLCVLSLVSLAGKCLLVNMKTGKDQAPSLTLATAIEKYSFQWTVLLAVFGRAPNGDQYMKCEQVNFTSRYRQCDLVDYLNEKQNNFLDKSISKEHVINAGWIAVPYQFDIDASFAGDLFSQFGAFDALAKWECAA